MLPFFKDDRYIKINNMPVFVIYRTSLISCLGEMVAKWREWAVEEGFDGINMKIKYMKLKIRLTVHSKELRLIR